MIGFSQRAAAALVIAGAAAGAAATAVVFVLADTDGPSASGQRVSGMEQRLHVPRALEQRLRAALQQGAAGPEFRAKVVRATGCPVSIGKECRIWFDRTETLRISNSVVWAVWAIARTNNSVGGCTPLGLSLFCAALVPQVQAAALGAAGSFGCLGLRANFLSSVVGVQVYAWRWSGSSCA